MQDKAVVLYRPEVDTDQDRVLAEGMRAVWASGLYACGADLFVPEEAVEGGLAPSPVALRGRHLTHDRQPLSRHADAFVTTRFVRGPGSLRIIVFVRRPGRPPFMRSGRTFRGATAELGAMATTLHTVARAVGLQVPPEVGWRELTFSNRAADGLAHLLATGRESLPKGAHPRLLH